MTEDLKEAIRLFTAAAGQKLAAAQVNLGLLYLNGVTVDYHNDLNRRGFSVSNPQAKSTCGCGSSFSM